MRADSPKMCFLNSGSQSRKYFLNTEGELIIKLVQGLQSIETYKRDSLFFFFFCNLVEEKANQKLSFLASVRDFNIHFFII